MSNALAGNPLVDDSWQIGKGQAVSILQNPLRAHLETTGETPFSVPAHWHTMHDEQHTVLKGKMIVYQDGVRKVVTPESGPIHTKRGVIHSIEIPAGEETIMEEMTFGSDDAKEQKIIFFRSLFSPGISDSFLSVMQIFYHGDIYPQFPLGMRWLERLMVIVAGGWVAPMLGYNLPDKRLMMDPRRFPSKKRS
ncbi:hypothetical protein C8R45DRAFT_1005286 [Mycena sanguinolenta]|nr:hypothetical protein C8R45DRAFT_1005286 [Mycena sanguinolenta]